MTSKGNQIRVTRMVAQWFTLYATKMWHLTWKEETNGFIAETNARLVSSIQVNWSA